MMEKNTFNALIEHNPFGTYVVDADFRLQLISRGARKVFETLHRAEGRDFGDVMRALWSEPFASDAIARFRHTLATGESYSAPNTIEQRADIGAQESYDWTIERITLPTGGFGVICYFYDLTEREAWAKALKCARDRDAARNRELESLYTEAPLGLGMLDMAFRFLRINAALASMNGFPIEAHIGKSVWDLEPALRATAEPMLRRVLETGEPVHDVTIRGATAAEPGIEREWCEQFYPIISDDGVVIGIGIVAEEVTVRRAQEMALRDSEDELRRVLDQLFAFVGILTPDGRVSYANNAPLRAAGLTLGAVAGKPFEDAPWWSYDPAVQQRLREAIAQAARGDVVRCDVPVQLGDSLATIDFQLSPLRDRDGTITGLIPSGTVIQERIEAEAALRSLTSDLEVQVERRTAALNAANVRLTAEIARREAAQHALVQSQKLEAMGRLVAGVAHDFNNMLAAVLSGLSLIEKKAIDPVGTQLIEMVANAANRGVGLVKQLLAFARQQPLAPEFVDLAVLLAEAKPLIKMSLPADICLTIACEDRCWPVRVDPSLLHSALLNLAINARDAMPNGGALNLKACNHGLDQPGLPAECAPMDYVTIVVTDTGIGMSPEILSRVAEPFFTTKGVGKGSGLGVAMVYGFVSQSGGTVRIESEQGVGTSVSLFLPRAASTAEPVVAMSDTGSAARNATILVVDDDPNLRGIIAATLIDFGHDVIAADTAEVALALLDTARVDLVLTDVVMPTVDGIELARRIRLKQMDLPILFMTGHAASGDLKCEKVISKPFAATILNDIVNETLRSQQVAKLRSS